MEANDHEQWLGPSAAARLLLPIYTPKASTKDPFESLRVGLYGNPLAREVGRLQAAAGLVGPPRRFHREIVEALVRDRLGTPQPAQVSSPDEDAPSLQKEIADLRRQIEILTTALLDGADQTHSGLSTLIEALRSAPIHTESLPSGR